LWEHGFRYRDETSGFTVLVGDTSGGNFEQRFYSVAALLMALLCRSRRNIKCFY
jgi:hypothetical protein